MRGLVDHIDRHAGYARCAGEGLRVRFVVEAADGNGGAGEIQRLPRPGVDRDRSARRLHRHGAKVLTGMIGEDVDLGAGRGEELRLPRRRRSVAGDHRALALEREKDRQPRERLHARRSCLRGPAVALDTPHQ
jgi:hypothetical protein